MEWIIVINAFALSLDGDGLFADMIVSPGNNVIYAAERELEQFIINLIELIQLVILQWFYYYL